MAIANRHCRVGWAFPALALLALGLLLVTTAHAAPEDCARCPLTYTPVVDEATGLPFYNECLMKCQLGPNAKARVHPAAAGAVSTLSDKAGDAKPTDPVLALMPPPVEHGSKKGGSSSAPVTLEVVTRYTAEGYVLVGKPGYVVADDSVPPLKDPKPSAHRKDAVGKLSSKSSDGDAPDMTYFMRLSSDGNLYMRALKKQDMQGFVMRAANGRASVPGVRPSDPQLSKKSIPFPGDGNSTTSKSLGSRRALRQYPAIIGCSPFQGTGGWSCISGADDRVELTFSPPYPWSAVAWVGGCTGAILGTSTRTVLTAAHCLYDFYGKQWRWPSGIAAGRYRYGSPYGTISPAYMEVMTAFTNNYDFKWDMGLVRLSRASSSGSFGYGYDCSTRDYTLATAGYPGSKPANTYWYQFARTGLQAVCSGSPQKSFAYDTTQGQSGSPFWTQNDNSVRFVLSYYNSGLAITPASFSWISNFEAVSRG